jgi:hypothetical protein
MISSIPFGNRKYLIIRKWKRRDKRAKKEGKKGKKGEQDKKAQGKVPH